MPSEASQKRICGALSILKDCAAIHALAIRKSADGNSQTVQFIKPARFHGPRLAIREDHGGADKFGLHTLELAEDRGRAYHRV